MTNSNHSKPGENSQPQNSDDDRQWQDFLAHHDDLKKVESSRAAKKFERHAAKAEEKALRKLRIEDFNDSVFTQDNAPTRGYSVSWLDADDADDHFHAPNPQWSSGHLPLVIAIIMIVLGFVCIFAAVLLPGLSQVLGSISGILILLGFAVLAIGKGQKK